MSFESVRGITPEILFSHVENTASFLFLPTAPKAEFITRLQNYRNRIKDKLLHEEYFELCLCAHYSTVATFVPTDVDNQIRQKLWDQKIAPETASAMAELVLQSRAWNFRSVTTRYGTHPQNPERYVSGHQGEWFSVAVGAYAKHVAINPELANRIFLEIIKELVEETEIYEANRKAKKGIELLKCSTAIAHNLGDLDRVIDQWNLPPTDRLRSAVYKFGHAARKSELVPLGELFFEAGNLNKAFMASENHRHYPLRSPKCLRRSIDFLLPLGPFLDTWGKTIATHPDLTKEEVAEVTIALLEGFERLSSPKIPLYGYTRALAGILDGMGGMKRLSLYLPSKAAKKLQETSLQRLIQQSEAAFNETWAKKALSFLKL